MVKDNALDREKKGRGNQVKGSKHYTTKLTEDDVRYIRKVRGEIPQARLAKKFNAVLSAINAIQLRKTWKHVED